MPWKLCGSDKQSKFTAEIAIHFPGLKGLEKPIVWVRSGAIGLLELWGRGICRSRNRITLA